jgi:secretion/DNA translocation related CpaE-like protein
MPQPIYPLLLSADDLLTDEVLRLAAVSGRTLEVAIDPGAVRSRFDAAPLVLIGADLIEECRRAGLPRRGGVVIVARESEREGLVPLAQQLGAEFVASLPAGQTWLLRRLAETADHATGTGRVIGVLGGRGGAGASTLAVGLAVTGVRAGLSTMLVDADPMGGGIDLALGWEQEAGLRWPALAAASGQVDPATLAGALPGRGPLTVLSWSRDDDPDDLSFQAPAEAMNAALDAARRGVDLVVVDLPRRFDQAAEVGAAAAHSVFLLVPAELRAVAAASRVARAVTAHCRRLAVVVRGPSPGGLRADEVAHAIGLPLAGEMRPEPGLAAALERGITPAGSGRGPLADLCRSLLKSVEVTP